MQKLSSPLIVYPKAKQKRYATVFAVPYTALSLWRIFLACGAADWMGVLISLALLSCTIWLVCAFVMHSTRNITVVLLPTLTISVVQIIGKVVFSITHSEATGIWTLILELTFWGLFMYFFIKGIFGKCKIILPMTLLFFGFFYAFIGYELRAELPIWTAQINLFLILWFVLDAATFTSLPKEETR